MKKAFNIIFYIFYIISAAALIFALIAESRAIAIILPSYKQIDHVTLGLIYEFCIPLAILFLIILAVMNKNTVKAAPAFIPLLLFVISFALFMFVFGTRKIYAENGSIYMPVFLGSLISLIAAAAALIAPMVIHGKALRKKAA